MSTLETFLLADFLGTATWLWLSFLAVVIALLAFDLGVLHRDEREIGVKESLMLSAGYISMGLLFSVWVFFQKGGDASMDYLTGFLIEKSLSMDNVFVIALIFSFLAIPRRYQHRVLFWGILGVIVLRAIMIGLGAALISEFDWILYVFGAFLLFTGLKMMLPEKDEEQDLANNGLLKFLRKHLRMTDEYHGEAFFVVKNGLRYATPMFVVLVFVELSDVVFAVDSIPAIFAVTMDPFIVLTSNIFAILGLRAMFFLLADVADRFHLLRYGLAIVLSFIGMKLLLLKVYHIPIAISLGVVFTVIAGSVIASLMFPKKAS